MAPSSLYDNNHEYGSNSIDTKQIIIKATCKPITQHEETKDMSEQLVLASLAQRVERINQETCDPGDEDAFFVADLGEIYRQQIRWHNNLRRVIPHYAVKCNPDPKILQLLAALGCGFDCASKAEIDTALRIGINPDRIIYAQPCKTASYLRHAVTQGIKQMTFDNVDELHKIKRFHPDAELFLRILTDDSASLCRLSLKFGAAMDNTKELLEQAKKLQLNVVGVAFHVGSGASDPNAFRTAIKDARIVFDTAASLGFNLHTVDIGGGFVSETFETMAGVISTELEALFPPHIRIIAEPGRFYVSSAFTIACNVIARRTVEDAETGEKSYMLYLNDGVYGNFSSIMFDHQHPIPEILSCRAASKDAKISRSRENNECGQITFPPTPPLSRPASPSCLHSPAKPITYSIWGPTCDGIDCISEKTFFTETLDVGDWLYFKNMGAYTKCSATRFNGFTDQHEVLYISSEKAVGKLLEW